MINLKSISLEQIDNILHYIDLQNGKKAKLISAEYMRVREINLNEDIIVYKYNVPCPLCEYDSMAFSYDGKFFVNTQLNCRHCGIYFRPVIKR